MMLIEVLLACLLIALDLTNASRSELSLKALCNGDKVELRTIKQLNSLVDQLGSAGGECPDAIKTALKQLEELIEKGERDVCTMEQAEAITQFVDNHLKDAADGTKRSLPKPLEKFIVAYGMKVSGICSHKMLRELPLRKDFKYTFDWSDNMDEFFWQVSDTSPLGMVLGPLIKPGEVILPTDLLQAIPALGQKIHLMIPKEMGLLRFKFICNKIFQPLYEPLMLPLAHLSRAGFNNREFYWAWKYHYKSRFWSRTVFLCEIAKKIEYDPEQEAAIMEDEQAAIKTEVDGLIIGGIDRLEAEQEWPTITVKAKPAPTGDKILGRFDYSMKSLVKAFDANKDYVQLLRERIMKRGLRVLRLMFKKRGLGRELKETLSALQVRSGSISDLEEAKKLLSKLMDLPQDDSTAYNLLVVTPKFILDVLTSMVCVVIAIIPLLTIAEITSDRVGKKVKSKFGDFFLNNFISSDLDLEAD